MLEREQEQVQEMRDRIVAIAYNGDDGSFSESQSLSGDGDDLEEVHEALSEILEQIQDDLVEGNGDSGEDDLEIVADRLQQAVDAIEEGDLETTQDMLRGALDNWPEEA